MPEYKINQKVKMIDEVFEGVVVEVQQSYVTVRDTNGFDFEIEKNKLIPVEHDEIMQKAYSQHIINKDAIQIERKHNVTNPQLGVPQRGVLEVDLHIEQLTQSIGHVSKTESLPKQLAHATKTLDLFLRSGYSKVVFIHGVGEGKLKSALHQLFRKYPVTWYDADFRKYGIGATEVVMHQRKQWPM